MKLRVLVPIIGGLLAGCASTGVVPADKGTFMVSKTNSGGVFGNPEAVKAELYVEANAHCEKTGQAVETVSSEVKGAIPFVRLGGASLNFRCVPK